MLSRSDLLKLVQAAALNERQPYVANGTGFDPAVTEAWAQRLLGDDAILDAYLQRQGLDRVGLATLLSGGSWVPRPGGSIWLEHVDEWLVHPSSSSGSYTPASGPLIIEGTAVHGLPFLGLLGPVVAAQAEHFDRWPWLMDTARASLLDRLAARLATLSLRCLLTELAKDRTAGAYERLDTSLSSADSRLEFYARYPVVARDLILAIENWRAQVQRILIRLGADSDALSSAGLLPSSFQMLESVDLSAGDSHDAGQSVAILHFAGEHRLVYKPRDCTVFAIYHDIVAALAAILPPESRPYAPVSLTCLGYGWVEYIEHDTSTTTDLAVYLRKLGSLLAIAHILGASDLHLENVIASPAGPVPVDLETLIQNRSHATDGSIAARNAVQQLNASVLGTGILPVQLTAGEGTSIDVSVSTGGLQEDAGHATVHQVLDPLTDRMRIEAVEMPIGKARNQPPGMTRALIREHRATLCTGFADTYRAVLIQRVQLQEILSAAPDMTVRHIVRATRSYSLLLTEMRQPGRLRSGIDRDHLLRSLWARLAEEPEESELIRAEESALRRLDVPLFTARMDSRALCADGQEVLPGYFDKTTREDVKARIDRLTEDAITNSVGFINESILSATPALETIESSTEEPAAQRVEDPDATFRRAAHTQGRLLIRSAILGKTDATWISVCSSTDSTALEYRPIGPTLYDGLAGITFATTYAHSVLPGLGLDDLAHRTAHAIAAILDDWAHGRLTLPIGAFSGAAGLLYALTHYDTQLGDNTHEQLRADAIRRLAETANQDTYFDVMAGAAGACAVVASIPEASTILGQTALRQLTTHLVEHAVDGDDGSLAWETGSAQACLGGFSHGATGIGWALGKSAAVLNDGALATAALRALRFDDVLFDPATHRWLDARPESLAQGQAFPAHWCHGTAGIAMARAASTTLLNAPELLDLAVLGARETTSDALPSDDSLCHGALGNLLAMREVARHTSTDIGLHRYRDRTVHRMHNSAPRSGLPRGVTTVRGLMLGTAGALYALCQELDCDVPNVLLLEGPRSLSR